MTCAPALPASIQTLVVLLEAPTNNATIAVVSSHVPSVYNYRLFICTCVSWTFIVGHEESIIITCEVLGLIRIVGIVERDY